MKSITQNSSLLAVVAITAFGAHPKLARDLDDASGSVDVIVQYRQTPTELHHKKVTSKGGQLKTGLDVIKAGHYSVPAAKLLELANDPDIAYISPDRAVKGSLDYAADTVGADFALKNGFDGMGVGVAVIDSGLTDHWDLRVGSDNPNNEKAGKSRVIYEETFVPVNSNGAKTVKDEMGMEPMWPGSSGAAPPVRAIRTPFTAWPGRRA